MLRLRCLPLVSTALVLGLSACGGNNGSGGTAPNSLTQCSADKLRAASDYCAVLFDGDSTPAQVARARAALTADWSRAEGGAAADGLSCSDLALAAAQAAEMLGETKSTLVDSTVAAGADPGDPCIADFLTEASVMCSEILAAESDHLVQLLDDSASQKLDQRRENARREFLPRGDVALDACLAPESDPRQVSNAARAALDEVADQLANATVAAPGVDSEAYITLSPTGTTEYLGRSFTPVCMDGSDYSFFARRGTVNKLVMYYQGGGACWEKLTCALPACDTNVDVDPNGRDNPNNFSSGFADANNPMNPFRNWHTVFVSYCGCDIHFGDAAQDYVSGPNDTSPLHVEHRGYQNARVVEKWAREHFIAPEEVFVTGSSAGAYGAWFHAPQLHEVWPWAQFHVLADAGNGVITQDFLDDSFPNWNFEANLPPNIPGIKDVLLNGTGIPGYTEVVAKFFPDTNWAHYATAYDGGRGGQTGFYNIMLNDNDPIHALTWWEGSCQFNTVMRQQAMDTADVVPKNYRYYIGTGSRHTMWGSNKVYGIEDPDAPPAAQKITDDPLIVDWVRGMLESTPSDKSPDWFNFECEDCGRVLPGDPRPDPLKVPFETRENSDGEQEVAIVCD